MNYQLITRHRVRDLIALAAALAAPPAAAAALLPWRGNWSNTNVALLLMVVVVAVATIGSRRAGALAALGAAAWFDFFFTVPYDRFTIRSQADITTFVLLLVVGLAVSQLAARARRLKAVTITAAAYLAQLHQTALLAQSAPAPQVVVDHVRDQLIDVLGLAGCRFEYGTLLGVRLGWNRTGRCWRAGSRGMLMLPGCPPGTWSCGYSAVASTTAGSCLPRRRAAGPPCRLAWSRSRWPGRRGMPWPPARPRSPRAELTGPATPAGPVTLAGQATSRAS
jgi:hypothetical protein